MNKTLAELITDNKRKVAELTYLICKHATGERFAPIGIASIMQAMKALDVKVVINGKNFVPINTLAITVNGNITAIVDREVGYVYMQQSDDYLKYDLCFPLKTQNFEFINWLYAVMIGD